MTQEERVARINALAAKARAEGLTQEELAEREQLRRDYLADFRAALTYIRKNRDAADLCGKGVHHIRLHPVRQLLYRRIYRSAGPLL